MTAQYLAITTLRAVIRPPLQLHASDQPNSKSNMVWLHDFHWARVKHLLDARIPPPNLSAGILRVSFWLFR